MMPKIYEFVKGLGLKGKTLDVGSMNINGCVRDLFPDYIGLDMRPGQNVDIVAVASKMPFADGEFDNVVCLEMLEHDASPFESIREMRRVLKVGGSLVIAVPSYGFPRHDFPSDYWRFSTDGVGVLLAGMDDIKVSGDTDHAYAIARNR